MATGMARGAAQRGVRIAFGDGSRIIWDQNSPTIFKRNLNIAVPGTEKAPHLEWVPFYKGNRLYNRHDRVRDRWIWNMSFRPQPGEMFFAEVERRAAAPHGRGFILLEPNVPAWKTSSPNKRWPAARWIELAQRLRRGGHDVCQFSYPGATVRLPVRQIPARSLREALAVLAAARLYVGHEGGMHHGAAAVGVSGVVLFGGFIPPQVTGYDMHANLAGSDEFCGSLRPCDHCRRAMLAIELETVEAAVREKLAA
jgi:hypothetical protein